MTTPNLVVQDVTDDVDSATQIPTSYGSSMRTSEIECARLREVVVYLEYTYDSATDLRFLLEGSDDGGSTWFKAQDDDGSGSLADAEKTREFSADPGNLMVRFDVTTLRMCRVSVLRTGGSSSDTGKLSHNGSNG